jgi:hypothetical protein
MRLVQRTKMMLLLARMASGKQLKRMRNIKRNKMMKMMTMVRKVTKAKMMTTTMSSWFLMQPTPFGTC